MTTTRADRGRPRGSKGGLGRRGLVLLALALVALAAFVVATRRPATPEPESRLSSVPEGALVLLEIDLKQLRSHPLGAELVGQGRQIAGLGPVRELCPSDPLDTLDTLVIAIPELEGVGFGLFGSGRIEREPLATCAMEVVRRRGGRPERAEVGDYAVVRDASLEPESAELAIGRGSLVLAEPAYLRRALASREAEHAVHRELRALVRPGVVVATAVLSETQRATLRDELRAQGEPDSPFAAIRDGALSLALSERLEAEAVLRCADPSSAERIAALLSKRRDELAAEPSYRLLGVADLVAGIAIGAESDRVILGAAVDLDRLLALADRLRMLEELMQPAPEPPEARPSAPVPPDHGERLEPADKPR